MKNTGMILLCLIMSMAAVCAYGQQLSNKGKEFWVGYGLHQFMERNMVDTEGAPNTQEMVLYLSAEHDADVTVSIDSSEFTNTTRVPWKKIYHVLANQVVMTDAIPKTDYYDARLYTDAPGNSEGLFTRKGIHIVSSTPIVAYAYIYAENTSGATMLMPVETWGYSYTSLNSKQMRLNMSNTCYSWMYVVAQHDNTKIEIVPSVNTRNGHMAGVPYYATLQRGHIYQVIGAPNNTRVPVNSWGYELSGTTVRSIDNGSGKCYPVAVFSGSSRTENPCGGLDGLNTFGGDNDMQQVFPRQAWGKRYLTAPTSESISSNIFMTNIYKILVQDPNTVVKKNGIVLPAGSLVMPGSYYYYESNTADYIEADKPVMVAQYMSGGCISDGEGDPEMIYLSPLEQGIKHIGFFRNNKFRITRNYLTLIIPDSGVNSLKIGGLLDDYNYKYKHPNLPGYSVVIKRWNGAQAQCIVESDSAFTAITYGMGGPESYGYNAGTMINNLNTIGFIHNQADTSNQANEYTCVNTPVEIRIKVPVTPSSKIVWLMSQVPGVTPSTDYPDPAPVPVTTEVIRGVTYYTYRLPGTYRFNRADTFLVPILNTNPSSENCIQTDSINLEVIVKDNPKPVLTAAYSGCLLDTIHLHTADTTVDGLPFNRFAWVFPGNDTVKNRYNVDTVYATTGDKMMLLHGISNDGCTADTSFTVKVFAPPVASIAVTPAGNICVGDEIAAKPVDSYGGPGVIKEWYWDMTEGDVRNVLTADPVTKKYQQYGGHTIKHVAKVSNTCISDTATATVIIYDIPAVKIDYPLGCLPDDGKVHFVTTNTVRDVQAMTTYSWYFDDALANAGNPNTSSEQSPYHNYSAPGEHHIQYRVTTDKGCFKDTVLDASFNVRPVLSYPALADVCAGVTTSVSVAKATVSNGVAGTGIYKGDGTDAAGNFTPSVAGAGPHTIKYIFTSDKGCIDSVPQTILAQPKPIASFTTDASICKGDVSTFTDQSSASGVALTRWGWNFGDGPPVVKTSGVAFTKTYTAYNTYQVKLAVTDARNCVSDSFPLTLTVHALPVAAFTAPAAICMPAGKASFTNQSTVADNATLSNEWDMGDRTPVLTSKDAAHVYTAAGNYTVVLKVTTADGCTNSISHPIASSQFYNQPVADFTVTPDKLCEGADNVFTDKSTAAGSSIKSWSWDFADGTTSAIQSPVMRYHAPGHYSVTLTVTNSQGCVSRATPKDVIVYLQPKIDAGPSFSVPQGQLVRLAATAENAAALTLQWTPDGSLINPHTLTPSYLAIEDQHFLLKATGGEGNCSAIDSMDVKVQIDVVVPNIFSPNDDRVNDTWEVLNLDRYPGATVNIFNRYGQLVYSGKAVGKVSWTGMSKGKPLPVGTYYYIIDLKNGKSALTGSVTIVR